MVVGAIIIGLLQIALKLDSNSLPQEESRISNLKIVFKMKGLRTNSGKNIFRYFSI